MINLRNIIEKARTYQTIISNFSYLSLLQVFNILVPLLVFPYLVRTIGPKLYGEVIFAQAIIAYLSILISYGFNLTATKEVSINRNDPTRLSKIVSSVIQVKFLLWFVSFILMVFLLEIISTPRLNNTLLLLSFTICFNDLLFPQWYFQGLERMKYITYINLSARLVFLILIFMFVRSPDDYLLVPLLNGIGAFLGGISGLIVVFAFDKIRFQIISLSELYILAKESFPVFASNLVIAVKDKFNVIFIGLFLGMDKVPVYDLGVKIINLLVQPIILLNDAIFPKVALEKNMKFLRGVIKLTFIFSLLVILILQPFIKTIVEFIGSVKLAEAVTVARILLISPLILSVSMFLSRNCIIVYGRYKLLLLGMVLTTLFYLSLVFIGNQVNLLINVKMFAWITVSVFLFELIYRIIICRNLGFFNISRTNAQPFNEKSGK